MTSKDTFVATIILLEKSINVVDDLMSYLIQNGWDYIDANSLARN